LKAGSLKRKTYHAPFTLEGDMSLKTDYKRGWQIAANIPNRTIVLVVSGSGRNS